MHFICYTLFQMFPNIYSAGSSLRASASGQFWLLLWPPLIKHSISKTFSKTSTLSTVTLADDKFFLKTFWCWGKFCRKGKGLICQIVDEYALSLRTKDQTLNPSIILVGCASILFLFSLSKKRGNSQYPCIMQTSRIFCCNM